jgi:hypothetical protein
VTGSWRSGRLAARGFRRLAGGKFASTIGDYCYAVALPWLVLSAHGGTILLGTVLACYGVPRTVLIPFAGREAGAADLLGLGGLTQHDFRAFGARDGVTPPPHAASAVKAAEGSRK